MKIKALFLILPFFAGFTSGAANLEQQIDELIPKLADDRTEARYEYQMQLQDLVAQSSRPGAEDQRAVLAKILSDRILKPEVPQPAKVWMVRQLEYAGSAEAVPALTTLLNGPDSELRECARRALEKNGDLSARQSLRQALQKATDPVWQIGLIHALGEQRDGTALPVIAPFLDQVVTAQAAARALGKIASPEAVDALTQAWKKNHPAAGDALVIAADELIARNKLGEAQSILMNLSAPNNPIPLRCAALGGLVQANPDQANRRIEDALKSDAPALRQAAIQAVAAHPEGLLPTALQTLPSLPAQAQLQVLDVADASAEKAVLQLVQNPDGAVRLAAIQALGRMGGVSSVPVLIQTAASQSAPDKTAAQSALARLPGEGVSDLISRSAAQGDPAERAVAIRAAADRGQRDIVGASLAFAAENNDAVTAAALSAIGALGSDKEVQPLAAMVAQTGNAAAGAALKSVVTRAENKARASRTLVDASRAAQGESLAILLDVLTAVGGDAALALVRGQLERGQEPVKMAALRALSQWPDYAATTPLLNIAGDPQAAPTQQILALRGIARLIKESPGIDPETRVQLAQKAMALAKRPDEKKLLISSLGAVGHPAAVAEVQPLLTDPDLRIEAAQASLQLAQALLKSDQAKAKALAKAVLEADISSDINRAARRMLR